MVDLINVDGSHGRTGSGVHPFGERRRSPIRLLGPAISTVSTDSGDKDSKERHRHLTGRGLCACPSLRVQYFSQRPVCKQAAPKSKCERLSSMSLQTHWAKYSE